MEVACFDILNSCLFVYGFDLFFILQCFRMFLASLSPKMRSMGWIRSLQPCSAKRATWSSF